MADIPTDHPSCSKQHAVLQFRWATRMFGLKGRDWNFADTAAAECSLAAIYF